MFLNELVISGETPILVYSLWVLSTILKVRLSESLITTMTCALLGFSFVVFDV